MKIFVSDLQKSVDIDKAKFTRLAKSALRHLGRRDDLSIAFVDDKKISKLNAEFRGQPHPTDVLAFGMYKGGLLGDVIISTDAARRQAPIYKSSVEDEIILYLIHGILHLVGYNDKKLKDRKKMEAKQRELLDKIRN